MSEFHVDMGDRAGNAVIDPQALELIEDAIYDVDPAAVIDFTPSSGRLRVAAALDSDHLATVLGFAGYPVGPDAIEQLPSICCGGCSG
ncbi:hypothetical protein [Lysobacter sp. A03]|uniref:hypothetical protein n=1 Tax=Lysobacter sp. A03 TaxID=1199154 RepID=UPI0005B6E291|nr:hypothetical protein [Lysobacter sp. A03]KIQ96489.1 hypothetical protein TI01_1938 [Lysobacter sp. A03]